MMENYVGKETIKQELVLMLIEGMQKIQEC
jgi:hypothetical protein